MVRWPGDYEGPYGTPMPTETGLVGRAAIEVGDADTAAEMRSGDVPALATPRLIALCEQASVAAVEGQLDPDHTTVGVRVQLDHLAPVGVGQHVEAEAVIDRVEGRRLVFNVSVHDQRGLVAAGKVTRVVVERQKFLDKISR